MRLEVKDISCGYAGKTIISGISLEIESGESMCLLGPNGVGKTTFFKTLLGLLKLKSGRILLNGEDINKWSRQTFAQKVGYVPQLHTPPFPFKVIDVVVMGRTAHVGVFSSPSTLDKKIAVETLEMLNIKHLSERVYSELSGGERQLVMIARALCQQPEILIMDEPTSNLDFGNQVKVLEQIRRLTSLKKISVIMTTHFPNHAFLCASKVAIMGRNGFFTGDVQDVISEEVLKETYGVEVKVLEIGEKLKNKLKICVPVLAS